MEKIKRFLPLLSLLFLMGIGYLSGIYRMIDFETLRYHHVELVEYVNNHPFLVPFIYISFCTLFTALSIPGIIFFYLMGGFLFIQPLATLYAVIGTTIGALLLFFAAKLALGNFLLKDRSKWVANVELQFQKNPSNYLLFSRLVPFFPHLLANILPVFLHTRPRVYFWTTLIGITPQILALTLAGRGLNVLFEKPEGLSMAVFLTPNFKIALTLLGLMVLFPVFVQKLSEKKSTFDRIMRIFSRFKNE